MSPFFSHSARDAVGPLMYTYPSPFFHPGGSGRTWSCDDPAAVRLATPPSNRAPCRAARALSSSNVSPSSYGLIIFCIHFLTFGENASAIKPPTIVTNNKTPANVLIEKPPLFSVWFLTLHIIISLYFQPGTNLLDAAGHGAGQQSGTGRSPVPLCCLGGYLLRGSR